MTFICPTCGIDPEKGKRPYSRSGLPSVTTVTSVCDIDSSALLWWASGCAAAKAVDTTEWRSKSRDDAYNILRRAFDEDREGKAANGTVIHHFLDHWQLGENIDFTDQPGLEPYIDAAENWWMKYKPEVSYAEKILCIEGPSFVVGTTDCVGTLEIDGERVSVLWDYKTVANAKKNYPPKLSAIAQVGAYANGRIIDWETFKKVKSSPIEYINSCERINVDHVAIVEFRSDGRYRMTLLKNDDMVQNLWRSAVSHYLTVKSVSNDNGAWI